MKHTNMKEGSPEEEASETPQEEQDEQASGEGVVIPEEFQTKVHHLLKDADKHNLAHVRDRVYQREDELRKEEMKKDKSKSKNKGPETMSVDTALEG